MDEAGERIFTPADLSIMFDVSVKTLYNWEEQGLIPKRQKFRGNKAGWRESILLPFLGAKK